MRIEWIGPKRIVPRVGTLNTGDIRDIPGDIAKGLIDQKLAKPEVKPIVKTVIKEGGKE